MFALGTSRRFAASCPPVVSVKIKHLKIDDPDDPFQFRQFRINDIAGSPPGMPAVNTLGTVELGDSLVTARSASARPPPNNPPARHRDLQRPERNPGYIQLNRANVVLDHRQLDGPVLDLWRAAQSERRHESHFHQRLPRRVRAGRTLAVVHDQGCTLTHLERHRRTKQFPRLDQSPARREDVHPKRSVYAVADEDTERTFTFDS